MTEPTVTSGWWRWRGALLVIALAVLVWAAQVLVLRFIAGNGMVLVLLALVIAVVLGTFYGLWAVRSSGATDLSQNAFRAGVEMPLRRLWARRHVGQAEVWYRWAMGSHYPDQALAFLQEAAARNHPDALFEFGLYLAEGGLGLGGRVSARDYFRRAAELGHPESAFHYAEMIRWGEGAVRNGKEAHRWYLRSAKLGFPPAMAWLASAYDLGEGTEQNSEEAAIWQGKLAQLEVVPGLRRSTLQQIQSAGDPTHRLKQEVQSAWEDFFLNFAGSPVFPWVLALGGMLMLALVGLFAYAWGITLLATPVWQPIFATLGLCLAGLGGLAIQFRRRMRYGWRTRWLDSSAAKGSAEACFRVGMEYLRGTSEKPRDPVTAKQWLLRAAEAGHVEAMFQVGDLLCWTVAGPRDPNGAARWFQKAAEANHPEAAARLEPRSPSAEQEN